MGPAYLVEITYQSVEPLPWEGSILSYMQQLLGALSLPGVEISLVFCNDTTIQELNKLYREKDQPTDVLSFPQHVTLPKEGGHLGDIIISLAQVEENSIAFGAPFEEEVRRVLLHGVLHLIGYDHKTNNPEEEPMLQEQERILTQMVEVRLF